MWTDWLEVKELVYENPLASPDDVASFRLEGSAAFSFPRGRLRMENVLDSGEGQRANFVLWCPFEAPSDVAISWDFWPLREPGLAILFFAAKGQGGKDLFDPELSPRTGPYPQYHSGDIDAYHVSYFRRIDSATRSLHTCNLRKSYGFHLVAQGPDPLPPTADARPPYSMTLVKCAGTIEFYVAGLRSFAWTDEGTTGGTPLGGGKIGFRQMSPLIADYANLQVHMLRPIR